MDDEDKKSKSTAYHRPEFIIIDEERYEETSRSEGAYQQSSSYYESLNKLHEIKPTLTIRIACLISSLMLFAYTAFIGVLMLLTLALVAITFGQAKSAVKGLAYFWSLLIRLFVISSGLFVGLFSPTFGLGIIILFFVLQGEKEDPILSRIIKSRFYSRDS